MTKYKNTLNAHVDELINLAQKETSLKLANSIYGNTYLSLKKATSPRFEIVFAGAFSAGKSMLINALLEQELLYSSEGHATGTECYIEYAEPEQQRIELTFLTQTEISEEVNSLLIQLKDLMGEVWEYTQPNFENANSLEKLRNECQEIILEEGGARKSDLAKKADALKLLLEGFKDNKQCIYPDINAVRSMKDLKLAFNDAAAYARRGSNSAVLKRINYFFNHHLLQRGNVIVDLPGIDAPVEKDAQLTYNKIEDSETSAVICVLKIASEGEITTEETQLLEKIRKNPGIRDRVFFVFNRIDETWYKRELATRLSELMNSEFAEEENRKRVYKTSALLGFYGSQIKHTSKEDRFGLNTILRKKHDNLDGKEDIHQFVYDFNRYCTESDKLTTTEFEISISNRNTHDERYLNTLERYGESLINQLIDDSGVKEFRECITSYFIEEKHRELFEQLADDLNQICRELKQHYEDLFNDFSRQPSKPEAIKAQKFASLKTDLQNIADSFKEDMFQEALKVSEGNQSFQKDFDVLKSKMLSKLDDLLNGFFLWDAYQSARRIHRQYITVPLLSVLGEAFYYLTSKLEDVLAQECENLVASFFERLINQVYKRDYYKKLKHLLGNDVKIAESLKKSKCEITKILKEYAHQECEYYLREDPEFYTDSYNSSSYKSNSEVLNDEDEEYVEDEEEYEEDEEKFATSTNLVNINNKVGIYQFREVLQQTFQDYTKESIESVQPVVRQLLQLDFQNKVEKTIQETFRHTFNSTLNAHLQKLADNKYQEIIRQDEDARNHLEQEIEKEARKRVRERNDNVQELSNKIEKYNKLINSINFHLKNESLGDEILLPEVELVKQFNQAKEELPEDVKLSEGKAVDEHSFTDQIEKSVDYSKSTIMESEPVQDVDLQHKLGKKTRNKASGFNIKASK